MTTLALIAALLGIASTAIIHGTDTFCALVVRPAAEEAKEASVADLVGRIHEYGDRRLPVPGVLSLAAAAVAAIANTTAGRYRAIMAVAAIAMWLFIYVRISAPINKQLRAAAATGTVPATTRDLQRRWDSVIWYRVALQAAALAGMVYAAIMN